MVYEGSRHVRGWRHLFLAAFICMLFIFPLSASSASAATATVETGKIMDYANAYQGDGSSADPYVFLVTSTCNIAPSGFWSGMGQNAASGNSDYRLFATIFENRSGNANGDTTARLTDSLKFDMTTGLHKGKNTYTSVTNAFPSIAQYDVWSGLGGAQSDWHYAFRLCPWTAFDTSNGSLRIAFAWKGCFGTYFDSWTYKFDATTLTKDLSEDKQLAAGDKVTLTYYGGYDAVQTSRGTDYSVDFSTVDDAPSIDGTDAHTVLHGTVDDDGYVTLTGDQSVIYGGNYEVAKETEPVTGQTTLVDKATGVSITGVFPVGTVLSVSTTIGNGYNAQITDVAGDEYNIPAKYEIHLEDASGTTIEPTTSVTLSMPVGTSYYGQIAKVVEVDPKTSVVQSTAASVGIDGSVKYTTGTLGTFGVLIRKPDPESEPVQTTLVDPATGVTVTGLLYAGTTLSVVNGLDDPSTSGDDKLATIVSHAFDLYVGTEGIIGQYHITLKDAEGNTIQPPSNVEVTVYIGTSYAGTTVLPADYYQDSAGFGTIKKLDHEIVNAAGYVSFNASRFSYLRFIASGDYWTQLSGNDRYGTMSEIVDKAFSEKGSCTTAILTSGENYPDALAVSALAGMEHAPIITTRHDTLSNEALYEIKRLGVKKVIIVGGTSTVSVDVETAVKDISSDIVVSRIAGDNRISTALAIYNAGIGAWSKTCVIASGYNFADALSISPYTYNTASPIFLTQTDGTLSDETIAAIKAGGFERFIAVGGTAAVSDNIGEQLGIDHLNRMGGANRYETSALIASWMIKQGFTYNRLAVASGSNYPDALVGSILCGQKKSVLLLVNDSSTGRYCMTNVIAEQSKNIASGYFLGGDATISRAMQAEIESIS